MEVRSTRKNKMRFFPSSDRVKTILWMHHVDADKAYGEKAWQQLHKNARSCIKKILETTLHKTAAERPPITHLENHLD